MLIDWFTVGAQALNFFVLVWLLKRFLYKPVLDAVHQREAHIAAALADADEQKAAADQSRAELQRKNEAFDQERTALVNEATVAAQAEGTRLVDAARKAADVLQATRDEALHREARALEEAITQRTKELVFRITRKALADLATTTLEERLCDVLVRRLRTLGSKTREQLVQASQASSEPAVVRSAFELPASQRAMLQKVLDETFSTELAVRFEVAPKTISGIELSCGGQKIGWSIDEYLRSLEQGVAELIDAKTAGRATDAAPSA